MSSDRELLRAHVATLFTRNAAGRLLVVNEPHGKPAPRFFLGRTAQGSECWFRADLSDDTVRSLEAARAMIPDTMETAPATDTAASFAVILAQSAPVVATWSGPAFRFPSLSAAAPSSVRVTEANAYLLEPLLEDWSADVERTQPLCAIVLDGRAVSVCASVRRSAVAHEAGVETAAAFRGNGYATQVVRSWAAAVTRLGLLPLYSTAWSNVASRALAGRLGLVQYASDLHLT